MTTFDTMARAIKTVALAEDGPMFMDWPDRWWEDPHWRCVNDHVSTTYLRTEEGARCLAAGCQQPLHLTFPEDVDGPLGPLCPTSVTGHPAGCRCL